MKPGFHRLPRTAAADGLRLKPPEFISGGSWPLDQDSSLEVANRIDSRPLGRSAGPIAPGAPGDRRQQPWQAQRPAAGAAAKEQRICGLHAVLAALRARQHQVRRLYFSAELRASVQPFLPPLAARRAVFRELPPEELAKVAGSHSHQGLAAVLAWPEVPLLTRSDVQGAATTAGVTLLLDGVANPHNLGAIARTAAFFGAAGLWVGADARETLRSAAAYRVAEGGLELLAVAAYVDAAAVVQAWVAAGGAAVALAVTGSRGLDALDATQQPLLLILGAEESGVSAAVVAASSGVVRIAGTGAVESLNVSVAAGIALAALGRSRAAR